VEVIGLPSDLIPLVESQRSEMDIFDTIEMNGVQVKVDNPTDYYLDEWLYSDYGFRMFYKPAKNVSEYYWLENLNKYSFRDNIVFKRLRDVETRNRSLNIKDFLSKSHVIQFVSDSKFYSYLFDYREGMILMRSDGTNMYNLL
jgi:hypothetical protein